VRRAGQHPPDLRRILRWVVTEFGADADPGEVSAEQLAAWFTAQWAERAPSTWDVALDAMRSAASYWWRQGWIGADPARLLQRRKPRPDRSRALSRAEVERLHTREDAGLRERTLWRMLYETAARSAEVLGLDVESLDLANRRARVRRKGGAIDIVVWQTGTARLLPRLLKGRKSQGVKRNQPGPHAPARQAALASGPGRRRRPPAGPRPCRRRTLKFTAVAAGLAFPHAAQAIQIVRRRRPLNGKKPAAETVYAITSLTAFQARPAELAAIIRGHWLIEDRLHWVRDMDWDEDRSRVRTGNGPRVMASLRNLAITVLRLTGKSSIAAALRYHARRPGRPLQTILNC